MYIWVDFFQLLIHALLCKGEVGKEVCTTLWADVKSIRICKALRIRTSFNNPVGAQCFYCSHKQWLFMNQETSVPRRCQTVGQRMIKGWIPILLINLFFSSVILNYMYHATYIFILAGWETLTSDNFHKCLLGFWLCLALWFSLLTTLLLAGLPCRWSSVWE